MNRTRKLFALSALALAAPAGLVACGDDGGGEDPAEVLRQAFTQQAEASYDSGVVDISIDGSLEGETSGTVSAEITGPFQSGGEGEAPQVQLDASADVSAEGPQIPVGSVSFNFAGGFALAEDSLFVTYQDQAYEASKDLYSQISPLLEAADTASEDTEVDPEVAEEQANQFIESLDNLENEGTEDLDGDEAIHVSGDLDFPALLEQSGAPTPPEVTEVFESLGASLDVYVNEADDSLRQIDFSLSADDLPEEAAAAGIEGGDLTFSFGISSVNEEQTVEAPSDAQPLDELLGQFGTSEQELIQGLQTGLLGGGLPGGIGTPGGSAGDPKVQECIANAADADAITECLSQ